jgi:glutamate 5-kinase
VSELTSSVEKDQDRKALFAGVRRVVVKLGTRVLTASGNALNNGVIERLAADVAGLRARGVQVAIVSSGAVGAGMGRLGLVHRPRRLAELQATAAVGQGLVMNAYKLAFRAHDIPVGQVLLTSEDLDNRPRYVNARNTLDQLFRFGAVPIINENDSVAVEELQLSVGENDRLAALVSHLIDAELLVLLTDVDGLFSNDPGRDPDAQLIRFVRGVPKALYERVGLAGSGLGRGGMHTKLWAAEAATQGGQMVLIANGCEFGIGKIMDGANIGTLFVPGERSLSGKALWMAHSRKRGGVVVDNGAAAALCDGGKSLLASGIDHVVGDFEAGELIGVENEKRVEIARGLARFGAADVQKIRGKKTPEIAKILNVDNGAVVIHRDDMVVF